VPNSYIGNKNRPTTAGSKIGSGIRKPLYNNTNTPGPGHY